MTEQEFRERCRSQAGACFRVFANMMNDETASTSARVEAKEALIRAVLMMAASRPDFAQMLSSYRPLQIDVTVKADKLDWR